MIDTHAHLLCFDNIDEIVDNMESDELENIVTIGTTIEDSIDSIKLAEKYKKVYATVFVPLMKYKYPS